VIVTADTTPPDTIIDSTPTDPTTSTSATFAFHATETSTFSCTLDSTPASCTSPVNYSSLSVGEHDFSVVATDAASNTDPTPATYSWTIEAPANCTTTVSSLSGVLTAIDGGDPGDTICLADGSYGTLSITANIAAPGMTIRAEHPGDATLTGVELSGSRITIARFDIEGAVVIDAGASGMTIEHNLITGGYKGVDMLTSSTEIDDTKIVGNRFVGPFGEDGIRANRYHDADSDGVGLLIEDNEFTNIRENGNHSDCLQTVWVGDHLVFRGNYVHDNRCQGFFVKDQETAVDTVTVEDNLFLRNDAEGRPRLRGPVRSAVDAARLRSDHRLHAAEQHDLDAGDGLGGGAARQRLVGRHGDRLQRDLQRLLRQHVALRHGVRLDEQRRRDVPHRHLPLDRPHRRLEPVVLQPIGRRLPHERRARRGLEAIGQALRPVEGTSGRICPRAHLGCS
jgi:hypothetical protein